MKINTDQTQQQKAVLYVNNTAKSYKDLLEPYNNRFLSIYKELNTFTYPKKAERSTTFKVNKMHEVSNKILPRIVSRSPKWIVSIKPDLVNKVAGGEGDIGTLEMQAQAIQDLLSTTFTKYNLAEPTRLRAKSMINYGPGFAKITTKYDISRTEEKVDEEEEYMDENGEPQIRKIDKKIKEKVVNQYATIEPISWTDLLYDPRYIMFKDMPAVVHTISGVRLSELKGNKNYINTDTLDNIINSKENSNFKEYVQQVTGLTLTDVPVIDKNNLSINFFYGLYDLKDDGNEKLYKIGVANGLVCICLEEITQIPFEQIRCFEDTETNMSIGFLEPIFGLQQELNFKKNSASEYINHGLNRSWIWSANSGVNPKKLISRPNNIISTTKSVDEALKNLQELPHREIHASYFQEQNDFERQIQGLTFTIDTNNSQNQQGLTNTATGMRIKFFESNVVIDEIRKHFEQGLERLAYKLLQEISENLDENLTIKQLDDSGFREINKEAIKDSLDKYEIKIETGSSSYDTIENRREDAMAKFNIGLQAQQIGVQVDMEKLFKDALGSFEGVNPEQYVKTQPILPMGGMPGMGGQPLATPAQPLSGPAQVTQQVAGGGITAGL